MLDLHIRTVTRRDLEELKVAWKRPDLLMLSINAVLVGVIYYWFREPLDVAAYHRLFLLCCIAALYSYSPHQEAKVAALRQIKDALVQFVELESKMYHRARKYRNQLAKDVNDLQLDIDTQRGVFYRLTSFFRHERLIRDTSTLEGLALRTSKIIGDVLSDNFAERIIKTRGFGPIIFVCLPKNAHTPYDFLQSTNHVVYGVYIFGRLVTRFHAATTLLAMFPETLESDRLVAMRQDALRLRSIINQKEHELHYYIKLKYGLVLDE